MVTSAPLRAGKSWRVWQNEIVMCRHEMLARLAAVVWLLLASGSNAEPARAPGRYADRLVLTGPTAEGVAGICSLLPDGSDLRTEWRAPEGSFPERGRVSPDGRSIAFQLRRSGAEPPPEASGWTDAILILTDGTVQELGLSGTVGGWSPDGMRLAVTQIDGEGRRQSYSVDVANAVTEKLALPEHLIIDDWGADGRLLLTVQAPDGDGFRHRRLLVADARTGVTKWLTTAAEDDDIWGRFSPRERVVAHCRRQVIGVPLEYRPTHCVVSNCDDAGGLSLTALAEQIGGLQYTPVRAPCWSPDGKEIVWVRQGLSAVRDEEVADLLIVRVQDGSVRRVPLPGVSTIGAIDWRSGG